MQHESQTREAADFNGRRILVTGGTKGIGEAIVERLLRGGGKVITTARSLPFGKYASIHTSQDTCIMPGHEHAEDRHRRSDRQNSPGLWTWLSQHAQPHQQSVCSGGVGQ